jgi:hypothetical protein
VAIGTCTVVASQPGDDLYAAAPQTTQTFAITANTGTVALRVTRGGTGTGTVTSTPAGIDCGSECAANMTFGATVTLAPVAGTDSYFGRWGGACSGTGGCTVSMSAAQEVTAYFESTIPRLANISTRAQVLAGDDVMIAGFIIQGNAPKTVVVRARGPSLSSLGVPGALQDPYMDLYAGSQWISRNMDWQGTTKFGCCSPEEVARVVASGFAPTDPREAAIIRTLNPGAYSAIVAGLSGQTLLSGVAIVEVFEVDNAHVPLANISTRAKVQTGDNVMIAGFIIQGTGPQTVVVRARGPSLTAAGVNGALQNPTMQLFRPTRRRSSRAASRPATRASRRSS